MLYEGFVEPIVEQPAGCGCCCCVCVLLFLFIAGILIATVMQLVIASGA